MRDVLKKLEQVQEIDLQIHTILRKKSEFPQRLAGFEKDIQLNTQKSGEKKKIVDDLEKGRRQQLGALELNDERAKRSQEKLEQIKTHQEYQALLKEIESLKKNSVVIQENANKVAEEVKKHETELATYEKALAEAKAGQEAESAKISGEQKALDADLERLNGLRGKAIEGIDRRYLAAYDRVRITKAGVGLVYAVAGSCKGCNMRIPPQIYNELQRGAEIHLCPSCKRILIYRDASKNDGTESSASARN